MLYVPILMLKEQEKKVTEDLNFCFSEKLMPLFEIIQDEFYKKYEIDSETGEFLRQNKYDKNGKLRRCKIPIPNTDDDIITLDNLLKRINGKKVFVDYFRFSNNEFPVNKLNFKSAELSFKLSNSNELYLKRIKELSNYDNLIPVISIKKDFTISLPKLKKIVDELHEKTESIALRLTDEVFDRYKDFCISNLLEKDFVFFDIGEQPAKSKFIEFEELSNIDFLAKVIILNSPRKKDIVNGNYPERDYTYLIDTSLKDHVIKYNFDGYGDYCGLKHDLPHPGGANGTALILFYDGVKNQFYSYCNKKVKGLDGFCELGEIIKEDQNKFDPENNCFAYKKIDTLGSYKSWKNWINVCIRRSISEIYKLIQTDKL
ncbi:MAG: hypothetical protein ACPKNR_10730 [Pleomorphochaeta sp.]